MAWAIEFENAARKELAKPSKPVATRIIRFLSERIAPLENPRDLGEALKGGAQGKRAGRILEIGQSAPLCLCDARSAKAIQGLAHRPQVAALRAR